MREVHPANSAPPPRPLLRLSHVASHCGVSLRTVQGWRAQGRLRVLVLGPRCLRVEPSELERFKREAQS